MMQDCTELVDVWSLGITAIELIKGKVSPDNEAKINPGQPPHADAPTAFAAMRKIKTEEAPNLYAEKNVSKVFFALLNQ